MCWASCSTVMAVTTLLLTLKFGAYWPVYLGTHWHFAGVERDSGVLCTSAEAWEGCCVFWIFANKSRPPSLLAGHGAGTGSGSTTQLHVMDRGGARHDGCSHSRCITSPQTCGWVQNLKWGWHLDQFLCSPLPLWSHLSDLPVSHSCFLLPTFYPLLFCVSKT
jgi:hypothetical protein